MLLSAVSVLVVAQSSSEIPEGLMNNPVFRILVGNLRKCTLTRPRKRWQDNNETDRRNLVRVQWWSNAGPLTEWSGRLKKSFACPTGGEYPPKIF